MNATIDKNVDFLEVRRIVFVVFFLLIFLLSLLVARLFLGRFLAVSLILNRLVRFAVNLEADRVRLLLLVAGALLFLNLNTGCALSEDLRPLSNDILEVLVNADVDCSHGAERTLPETSAMIHP